MIFFFVVVEEFSTFFFKKLKEILELGGGVGIVMWVLKSGSGEVVYI